MKTLIGSKIIVKDYNGDVENWCLQNLVLDNPKYITLERLGKEDTIRRTHVPKKIKNFVRRGDSLEIPFGCLYGIWHLIKNDDIKLNFNETPDISIKNTPCPVELYDYQQKAVDYMVAAKGGVLVSDCGSGKTFMGIEIIRRIGKKFLWLTHTGDLLRQTYSEFKGLYPKLDIGLITEGKLEFGKDGCIATVQTLDKIDTDMYRNEFEIVVCDECAHVSGTASTSKMFYRIMNAVPARYKYGLTATPSRSDTLIETMYATIGLSRAGKFEPTYKVDRSAVKTIPAEHVMIPLKTYVDPDSDVFDTDGTMNFTELINYLSFNKERNKIILDNIEECAKQGRKQVVLALRKEHVEYLCDELVKRGLNAVFVTGDTSAKLREDRLKLHPEKWDIIVATFSLFKEGINIKTLDTLHITVPVKAKDIVIQSVGRIERFIENKKQPIAYDYVDHTINYCISSYNKRRGYIKKRYD